MKASTGVLRGLATAIVFAAICLASTKAQARITAEPDALLNAMWRYCINPVLLGHDPHTKAKTLFKLPGGAGGPSSAEISYWLGREHRGRGLGSQLIPLSTLWFFRRYPDIESIFLDL